MLMSVKDGQTMFNLCANFCAPGLQPQDVSHVMGGMLQLLSLPEAPVGRQCLANP